MAEPVRRQVLALPSNFKKPKSDDKEIQQFREKVKSDQQELRQLLQQKIQDA